MKALAQTMMEAHDRLYVEQSNYARTIPIPTLGVRHDRVHPQRGAGDRALRLGPLGGGAVPRHVGLRRLHRRVPEWEEEDAPRGAERRARPDRPALKVFNLFGNEWDLLGEREGYRIRDAHVGARLGAELIGGRRLRGRSRREDVALPPPPRERGVADRPALACSTLRSPDGEQELVEGDTVRLPARSLTGAHQVLNRSDAPVRVLILSTLEHARARRVPGQRQGRRS